MKLLLPTFFLAFIVACSSPTQTPQADNRPNILFILADDLGKEWISAYGAEDIETPNIDALAASGMKFHNAYSMPQCTPTRLTLLTGQYPFRHGWVNHWDVPRWGAGAHYDERKNPSLGKAMKNAGYATCIAGKWQIDDFRVEPDALSRNGFDDWCMWTGYETGIPASAERYQNPYLFTKEGSKTYEGKFGPDLFKDFLVNFIKEPRDKPFFAYYPMVLPHTPLINTPDESADEALGKHKAMVRYVDKLLGQLVQAIDDAGLRENTLIIWTTDNGSTQAITGTYKGREVKGAKSKSHEAGACQPFIASWPKHIEAGSQTDALVDFTDIFPTFQDLAGIEPKAQIEVDGHMQKQDGSSFKGLLLDPESYRGRDWIMSMGGGNHARRTEQGVENQYRFRDRVLRNKRYKLYVGSDRSALKFYDLLIDPFEEENLIDSLNTEDRTHNFEILNELVASFPDQDSDPRYIPNPPQEWDVGITAESQVWKK